MVERVFPSSVHMIHPRICACVVSVVGMDKSKGGRHDQLIISDLTINQVQFVDHDKPW